MVKGTRRGKGSMNSQDFILMGPKLPEGLNPNLEQY